MTSTGHTESRRFENKVVFITGAARGQGRAEAVRFAQEGADIIAVDACSEFSSTAYAGATRDDLDETVRLVEATGRRIAAEVADVRDFDALSQALAAGVEAFGRSTSSSPTPASARAACRGRSPSNSGKRPSM